MLLTLCKARGAQNGMDPSSELPPQPVACSGAIKFEDYRESADLSTFLQVTLSLRRWCGSLPLWLSCSCGLTSRVGLGYTLVLLVSRHSTFLALLSDVSLYKGKKYKGGEEGHNLETWVCARHWIGHLKCYVLGCLGGSGS